MAVKNRNLPYFRKAHHQRRALFLESASDFRITDQDGATISLEGARLMYESGALQDWDQAFQRLVESHFDLEAVKRYYAKLGAAAPELYEALEADDRLTAGNVIHAGYKSKCSVETVHLLHCCLAQVLEHPERFGPEFGKVMVRQVKDEIQRLIDRAEKALAKAQGESPDATR